MRPYAEIRLGTFLDTLGAISGSASDFEDVDR
jgi:hypothetical protein